MCVCMYIHVHKTHTQNCVCMCVTHREFTHYWMCNIDIIQRVYCDTTEINKKRFRKLFLVKWNGKNLSNPDNLSNFDNQSKWKREQLHISTSTNH